MSLTQGSIPTGTFQSYTLLDGVTATTTSSDVPCGGAKRITFEFTRADHSAGSSAFVVEGSVDGGATFHTLALLDHAASQGRAVSVTLSANGSELHSVDLEDTVIHSIRTKVTETTDGTHTAKCVIEF